MHGLGWNYIAFFLVATVIGLVVMYYLGQQARREREPFDRAVPGVARILWVGNTGPSRSFGAIIMDLLIEVRRSGVEPYELSTMWSVDPGAVSKMKVGETFAIKVDPLDRTRVFSGEPWAHSLGTKKSPVA